jgi:hypothetical protein
MSIATGFRPTINESGLTTGRQVVATYSTYGEAQRAVDLPAQHSGRPGGPAASFFAKSGYIDSGAEMPSSPSALASVILAACARASRDFDRSGSSGSTTRASR